MNTPALIDWGTLQNFLCVGSGSYNIVEHSRVIFSERERRGVGYLLRGAEIDTDFRSDGDRALYNASNITRGLIVKAISLRDLSVFDLFVDESVAEALRFYSLLELSFLFHGCYVLDNFATNSDFWRCIESAQIDNPTFLSFHVFNYTYHIAGGLTGESTYTSNMQGVMSMTKSAGFYEESKLLEAREFMSLFVSKIQALLMGPIFDNQFKAFYDKYSALAKEIEPNPAPDGLLPYLSSALASSYAGSTPLAVLKLKQLVGKS